MSSGSAPPLRGVDHLHVHVSDRAAAERWYARVLGLTRVQELEVWAVEGGPLTLADRSGTVHLALFERAASARHATLALAVDGPAFLAWRTHLARELPAPPELEDHGLSWSLYFADPDGNPFELTTHAHAELAAVLRPEA
jgi:catechol-2,3-dioxygenase